MDRDDNGKPCSAYFRCPDCGYHGRVLADECYCPNGCNSDFDSDEEDEEEPDTERMD